MIRSFRLARGLCRTAILLTGLMLIVGTYVSAAPKDAPRRSPLDPCGRVHLPIGIANSVDTLKTFVEAEGHFSPGFATYGIYFWLYDPAAKKLAAPTMDGVACTRGLGGRGYLIPWTRWSAGDVTVKTEVCQVARDSPAGEVQIVAARVHLTSGSQEPVTVSLYMVLRPWAPQGDR